MLDLISQIDENRSYINRIVDLPVFFAGLPLKDPNDEGAPTDSHSGISKTIKMQELDIILQ